MTNRELETRYTQMKLAWKNLVNANIDLVDENKMLKEEIEKLNNIIKRLNNEISGAYTNLSNNENVNYMHEVFQKDLLNIIKDSDK